MTKNIPILCAPKTEVEGLDSNALELALKGVDGQFLVCSGGIASRDCRTRFEWEPATTMLTDGEGNTYETPIEVLGQESVCLVKKAGPVITEEQVNALFQVLRGQDLAVVSVTDAQTLMAQTRVLLPAAPDATPHISPEFMEQSCGLPERIIEGGAVVITEALSQEGCSPEEKTEWLEHICSAIVPAGQAGLGATQYQSDPNVQAYLAFLTTEFPTTNIAERVSNDRKPQFAIAGFQTTCAYLASRTGGSPATQGSPEPEVL